MFLTVRYKGRIFTVAGVRTHTYAPIYVFSLGLYFGFAGSQGGLHLFEEEATPSYTGDATT